AILKPEIYTVSNFISVNVLLMSAASIFIGALLAAIIPGIKAVKIKPLEAIKSGAGVKARGSVKRVTFIGVLLILVTPILLFVPGIELELRRWLFGLLGYSTLIIGFIMLVPALLKILEKIFVPILAKFLGFAPEFLQLQLSSNLLRSMGTIVSMAVGLALFCAVQIWGFSMVVPFLPNRTALPEMLAVVMPMTLPEDLVSEVKNISGIDKERFLGAVFEQPKISEQQRKTAGFKLLAQDNVTLMGIDIDGAFVGNDPMFNFSFAEGNLAAAIGKLKSGRYCLIPDALQLHSGLKVGDKLELMVPESNVMVSYEIAGVVHIPGWHWMTKTSGLRRRGGFTAGLVIASEKLVKEDFGLSGECAFWFDSVNGAEANKIENELQMIVEKLTSSRVKRPFAKLTTVGAIDKSVNGKAKRDIWAMSYLPLIMLVMTSLAMMNTVAVAVKARSWEFGVMRSLGVERGQLFRIVIAETLLMSFIAFVGSLLFGIVAAWCAINFNRYGYHFGGVIPEITVPWGNIA
ncbi:MAG: ABC transporter permease, partial [Lentisphaeria bacterium]